VSDRRGERRPVVILGYALSSLLLLLLIVRLPHPHQRIAAAES
jgi:hypothetical protein